MLLNALLHGKLPFVVMSAIAAFLNMQGNAEQARGTFCAALIALFVGAATVIYQIDSWRLTKQSVVHFLLMLLTVYPTLLFSGWFEIDSLIDALHVLLIFLFVGLVLWSIFFLLNKFLERTHR